MIWLNFLHLYQPAYIEDFYIEESFEKSYARLIRLLTANKNLKFTVNISGCLLQRLADRPNDYKIEGENLFVVLQRLIKSGQLELVSSAAYHGFLPLLPEAEVRRQIKENKEILEKYFAKDFKVRGFFSPEMAYSKELARIIKDEGYEWLILDSISAVNQSLDFDKVFIDEDSGLKIIFRNRQYSRAYPPDEVKKLIIENKKSFLITATDAELYGLRHKDHSAEMEKIVKNEKLETKNISEYISSFSQEDLERIKLRRSSWESEEKDLAQGESFIFWKNRKNPIHRDLWNLSYLSLDLLDKFPNDKNAYWQRWHLVRGLASCTYWWASASDFSFNFGPLAWNPDIVERGLEDLIRSVRAIESKDSLKDKLKAEVIYLRIKKNLWQRHWKKHWLK